MLLKKQSQVPKQDYTVKSTNSYITTLPTLFIKYSTNVKLYHPIFFFLRTQRRYNKRRLAKARVYSRTSFYSSCSLGSILIGLFWNASHKLTDWQLTLITIIDINSILLLLTILLIVKTLKLTNYYTGFLKLNKIKYVTTLKTWILYKIFNKY